MCPRELANRRDLVEGWLRDAVRAGNVGAWEIRHQVRNHHLATIIDY